ncbi:hypothetical protein [Candidatus Ichthyocystis sparus]|uniref:hypothetical protein n=3 Tax=Candidatus Ichthyocystis sparus TaxID=1561004 RepID=UPI0011466120|nr:hypothetical protein [Candidatus Ichthyocystis sparus]
MKRKLSSTSSGASSLNGNDGIGSSDGQTKPSSTLEQSTRYAETEGFLLDPYLAQALGMRAGESLFRSMFYGSPQAPYVSDLVAQLLSKQEELLCRGLGEGSSYDSQSSIIESLNIAEYNGLAIQALMDSIEAPTLPPLTATPEVVVGDIGIVHEQVPVLAKRSAKNYDEEDMFAPDLAQSLKMQPGQELRRSTFYNATQSDVVLGMVGQLSATRESVLHNQELERSSSIQEGTSVGCENTASLMTTSKELTQVLMGSIETSAVPTIAVEESETESKEKLEEERNSKLKKLKAKLEMKEQAKTEKLINKEEEEATKSREKELETALSIAVCRESELEKVKDKVKETIKRLETPGSLSATKRNIERIKKKEGELRRVVAEPRSENLKKMEKELNEARARCKELEKAGAVEFSIGMDYIRTKEIKVSRDLEEAKAGEIRVKNIEKNIEVLVAKELYLEKIEAKASKKELGKVRAKKTKIESNLMQLRATIATTRRNVELELVNIITLKEEIEATIDRGKREIELNRLKEGAKAESGEKELELMLRIEGVNARVRMLELELGLWLGEITAKQLAVSSTESGTEYERL